MKDGGEVLYHHADTDSYLVMDDEKVLTEVVEDTLASICTAAIREQAEKMQKSDNRCMGDITQIYCHASAFA